jgi:hypothetical protein
MVLAGTGTGTSTISASYELLAILKKVAKRKLHSEKGRQEKAAWLPNVN